MKSIRRCLSHLLSAGILLLAGLWCGGASATCALTVGTVATINIATPSVVYMPRDSSANIVFYTSPMAPIDHQVSWSCNSTSDVQGVVNNVGPTPAPPSQILPIGNTGLGWKWLYSGSFFGTYGFQNAYGGWGFGGTTHGFSLVKNGTVVAGTVIPAGFMGEFRAGTLTTVKMYLANSITIAALACTTPDVTVPLGTHAQTEMAGVGATTKAVSFNIALNNCPAGMNGIQYQIDPVTTVLNGPSSVVALDASSTASGVGVQLLDDGGNTFPLSTVTSFSGYRSAMGGNYTIPMKARYYRTAGAVRPGKANSSMTLTMFYQ